MTALQSVWWAWLSIAALVLTGSPVLAADFSADIKSEVEVRGDKVFLGDLAVLVGPDTALKRDLAEVYLTRSPRPGQSLVIRRAYLESRIRASGLPLDQVDWRLPEQTTVTRAAQTVTEDWVRTVVEDYLSSNEPYRSGEWELISLKTGVLPTIPAGRLEPKVMANPVSNATNPNLTIHLLVEGRDAGRVLVNAKVDMSVPAVVAARRLEKGRRIEPGDLKPAKVSVAQVREGALTDPSQAVGLVCRGRLQPGQPVLARDLVKAEVVSRGDMVTIVAQSGPLKVATLGQAKQSGAVGDQVAVINVNSHKTVLARVIGEGLVEVAF
ncbi:MAG: flagellar basal body P-ring formation chaperone FlgA [Thermodesulfobacteriota bacterium]